MALKARSDVLGNLRIFFAIHLRTTHVEFAPENIAMVAGINELNHLSVAHCLTAFVYTKANIHLSVGGWW